MPRSSGTEDTLDASSEETRDATLPAPVRGAPEPLEVVAADRYVDRGLLTQGGMGRIVKARDRRLQRVVAIKELRSISPDTCARFEREALLTARLQHPSIVSVHDAGRYPSGEPFFAMELVPGRSFDAVIGATKTLGERIGLLPHVLAVADALAYAHSQRIIHRDLKPHNVMIGEFGETVVIDWGLGKDLDTDEAPVSTPVPSSGDETVAGSVLGTPAYMPPEQARGEPVDERADVYAIGAILYHLLDGAMPYDGTRNILDAVRRGPPAPLSARRTKIPQDLVAIVDRAMAREASERYPTARELAEDLRRFQTGQLVGAHAYSRRERFARWVRRHRTAVGVGLAALVVIVAGSIIAIRGIVAEQRRTDRQRAVAEGHRGQAEELLDFMLVDLKEKLQPMGKLELLDAVARKAVAYYLERPVTDDAKDLHDRAVARGNLGDVLDAAGDGPAAAVEFREALALAERVAGRDPTNTKWQLTLSDAKARVANTLRAQGDLTAALREYQSALAIAEKIVAAKPAERTYQMSLFQRQYALAAVFRHQTRLDESLVHARASLETAKRLVAAEPDDSTYQRNLAIGHQAVGDALRASEPRTALTEFRASLAIAESLVNRDPGNTSLRRFLAVAYSRIGDITRTLGDTSESLAAHRKEQELATQLAAHDPTNAGWLRDVAISHSSVANALQAQGDLAAALASNQTSLELRKQLLARDATNTTWQRDVSVGHDRVGKAKMRLGDYEGALAEYRASLAIREKLVAKDPTNSDWLSGLGISRGDIGETLLMQRKYDEALPEFRAVLEIDKQLAAKDPNPSRKRDLSITHVRLGDALLGAKKPEEALVEYRAALALQNEIAATASTPSLQYELTQTVESIGDGLLAKKDAGGALAEYRNSLTTREALVAKDPKNARWQYALARAHNKVARALVAAQDLATAAAEYTLAIGILEKLLAQSPNDASAKHDLAVNRRLLAECCKR